MGQAVTSEGMVMRPRASMMKYIAGGLKAAVLLFLVGADCSKSLLETSLQVQPVDGSAPAVVVRVTGEPGTILPGGTAPRAVFVQCPKPGGPDFVTVLWYPPALATSPAFPGLAPSNPQGPPPFEFANVPVSDIADAQAAPSLTVSYTAPAPPQPPPAARFVDAFAAVTAAGDRYSASFVDTASAPPPPPSPISAGAAGVAASAVTPYRWWSAEATVVPDSGTPLDQQLCLNSAAFLQGGSFFLAVRFPAVAPDGADARSTRLPIVMPAAGATVPVIELRSTQGAPSTVYSVPLELSPQRLGFAENQLPRQTGERWVTLSAAAAPAPACPADLSGTWDLRLAASLDFGGTDTACPECVLQSYLCYEGTAAPFFFAALASPGAVSAQSIERVADTTCVGPLPIRLASEPPDPPFLLGGIGLARSAANKAVAFLHRLQGRAAPGVETTVDLGVASGRHFPWHLYYDSAMTMPIQAPVTISGSAEFDFWAGVRLPLGVKGPETVTVTATSAVPPGGQTWTTDHVWAGAWMPPPPVPTLAAEQPSVAKGGAVSVSGALPDGSYRIVVVPNGVYLPGSCYSGRILAEADVTVSGSVLPSTEVWPQATILGAYDVLALSGTCGVAAGDELIVTGTDLSSSPAVTVFQPPMPVRRHLGRR